MPRSCTKLGNDFREKFNYYGKLTKECMGPELWNEYYKMKSKQKTQSQEHIEEKMIKNKLKKEETKRRQELTKKEGFQYKVYCKNYQDIENFEKAKTDEFKGWVLHHRLENQFTAKELNDMGKYFDVPAEELIFLPTKEHNGRSYIHKGHRNKHWKNNKKL